MYLLDCLTLIKTLSDRQRHGKSASFAERACNANRAAHRNEEVVDDGKAQAEAAGGACARCIGTVEAFKDALEVLGGDAYAVIFNDECEMLGVRAFEGQRDDAA